MIPIKIDNSKVKVYCKKIDTSKGNYKSISSKLQQWIDTNSAHPDIIIARDIKNRLKKILIATPKQLELIIDEYSRNGFQLRIFNPAAGRSGELTNFGNVIKNIFNYKSFRQSKKAIWFSNSLNIKSCTTCNTQYTLKTKMTDAERQSNRRLEVVGR